MISPAILTRLLRGFRKCPDGLYRLTVQFQAPTTLVFDKSNGKLKTEKTLIPVDMNRGKCRINNA